MPMLSVALSVAGAADTDVIIATWGIRLTRPIIERLNRELAAILQMPRIQERFAEAGSTVTGGTPEQFHDYLKSELAKFGKLVKEAGIKAE